MQSKEDQFPITGKEGAPIDLKTAAQWTKNYRQMRPGERIAHLFGRDILEQILRQEGCMAIRMYYANSLSPNAWQRFILGISNFLRKQVAGAEGEEHLILVGVTREGKDQIPGREIITDPEKPEAGETPAAQSYQTVSMASKAAYVMAEQAYPHDPGDNKTGNDHNDLTG